MSQLNIKDIKEHHKQPVLYLLLSREKCIMQLWSSLKHHDWVSKSQISAYEWVHKSFTQANSLCSE